ncbi:unnamed protein product, partial [Didymodactylos carnosus]
MTNSQATNAALINALRRIRERNPKSSVSPHETTITETVTTGPNGERHVERHVATSDDKKPTIQRITTPKYVHTTTPTYYTPGTTTKPVYVERQVYTPQTTIRPPEQHVNIVRLPQKTVEIQPTKHQPVPTTYIYPQEYRSPTSYNVVQHAKVLSRRS